MATLATHLVTAEEFLGIEFDTEQRFELDNGIVRMMTGGLAVHARIQSNIVAVLAAQLRGSGCSAYGPDLGVRTHHLSLRYPDVSVFCGRDGPENDRLKSFDDPRLVVEVLSPSTRTRDIEVKLPEYRGVASLEAILYVDPEDESLHLELRDEARGWVVSPVMADRSIRLPTLGVTLTHDDIFSRG